MLKASIKALRRYQNPAYNRSDLGKLLTLFIVYCVTAHIGLSINAINNFATLVWPPTGIALAALLILGARFWPAIFFAAFLVNSLAGAPPLVAFGMAIGNTLEAIIGSSICMSQGSFRRSLDNLSTVMRLILGAALLSSIFSATIGVGSLYLGGVLPRGELQLTWLQWWTGDATGDLTIAPLILVFSSGHWMRRKRFTGLLGLEALLLGCVLVVLSYLTLTGGRERITSFATGLSGVYLLPPILIWGAVRFGQRASALSIAAIATFAVWGAATHSGPFTLGTASENLIHLITYLIVVSLSGLILGAIVAEREDERQQLHERTASLEAREIELKAAKEAAEAANAAKSAFLANMSHEIRTPLGAVLGFADLIANTDMKPSERESSIEAIKRNGLQLSNIINDILDLSKVEAGKLDFERGEISIREIARDMESLLMLEASGKGLKLTVELALSLPDRIQTDPLRLRQILLNVVGNAIKFTSQGSVRLSIFAVNDARGASKIVFDVIDTGCGIAEADAVRLFTPFTQADASITRRFGGTGLGLALSKRLAEALGGNLLLFKSQLGVGSQFRITIDPGVVALRPAALKPQSSAETPPAAIGSLKRMSVLVVDDSPDNQYLVGRILKTVGASVTFANNGEEGLGLAFERDFDIVLMDLQMPVMDGYQAMSELKKAGYQKPVIALTAFAMKEERDRCLASGFARHMCKPIDRILLISTLSELVHPSGDDVKETQNSVTT